MGVHEMTMNRGGGRRNPVKNCLREVGFAVSLTVYLLLFTGCAHSPSSVSFDSYQKEESPTARIRTSASSSVTLLIPPLSGSSAPPVVSSSLRGERFEISDRFVSDGSVRLAKVTKIIETTSPGARDGVPKVVERRESVPAGEAVKVNVVGQQGERTLVITPDGFARFDLRDLVELLPPSAITERRAEHKVILSIGETSSQLTVSFPWPDIEKALAARTPPHLFVDPTVRFAGALSAGSISGEESGEVQVTLANDGQGTAWGVKVAVDGSASGLTFPSEVSVGDLKPGERRTISIPVSARLEVPDGSLSLTLRALEQFGQDAVPISIPPVIVKAVPRPTLSVASFEATDAGGHAVGNGNGVVENGETVEAVASVRNDGPGWARGVKLTMAPVPGVTMQITEAELGDIPPGGTSSGTFAFRLPRTFAPPSGRASVPVSFHAADRRPIASPADRAFDLPVRINRPALTVAEVEFFDGEPGTDSDGNRNRLVEPDELVVVRARVVNSGTLAAEGATVALKVEGKSANLLVMTTKSVSLGSIPVGEGGRDASFKFKVPKGTPPGALFFSFQVSQADFDGVGERIARSISAPVDTPVLSVASIVIIDNNAPSIGTNGNDDGKLQPGEVVIVRVTARNNGTADAEGVVVSVALDGVTDKPLLFDKTESKVGILAGGGKETVVDFRLTVPGSVSPGPLALNATVRQEFFPSVASRADLPILPAAVAGVTVVGIEPQRPDRASSSVVSSRSAVEPSVDEFPAIPGFRRDNAYAVVIGVGRYKQTDIKPASYSVSDARSVREALVSIGGFPRENVILLTDDAATLSAMRSRLKGWLKRVAKPDSLIVVYFSGHGAPDPEKQAGYLLPYDGDPNYALYTGYSVAELKADVALLGTRNVVVAADACFTGGERSASLSGMRPAQLIVREDVTPTTGAYLGATRAEQPGWDYEEKKHGVFTYALLKGMRGEGGCSDDGYVEVDRLFGYLSKEVPAIALRTRGATQTPVLFGDGRNIKLTRCVR